MVILWKTKHDIGEAECLASRNLITAEKNDSVQLKNKIQI